MTRALIDISIHEIGHILGLRSKDLPYYYDRKSGKPRTPRPIKPSKTQCIKDFNTSKYKLIVRPSFNTMRMGQWEPGIPYYEIVTPTVAQVARNHYNCERMIGMRLENQPTSNGKLFYCGII